MRGVRFLLNFLLVGLYCFCQAEERPSHRRELQAAQACTEACNHASDGICDDGGAGAEYSDCIRGTDCTDCGPRIMPPPPSPPAVPPPGTVLTVPGLTSALADRNVDRIFLAPGTYTLSAELSIIRSVVLEAAVAGSVVLDAQASFSNQRRVLNINPGSSGIVELIGLDITRGYVHNTGGGGILVQSGSVRLKGCRLSPTKLLIQQQDLELVDIVELEHVEQHVSMDVVVDLMDVIVILYLLVLLLLHVVLLLHLQDVAQELEVQRLLIVERILVPLMEAEKVRFLDFVIPIRLLVRIARILVLRML